jgi:hypothetical protein
MISERPKLLLHGLDTVQICYYLLTKGDSGIDFVTLEVEREALRRERPDDPKPIKLGSREFLLSPHGSRSGYPFVVSDAEIRIEFGPNNSPPFFVTYRSEALWSQHVRALHERFLDWAASLGYYPVKPEGITRVDYCFDYYLPRVDFDEDDFISLSSKDAQHRQDGRIQTLTFGRSDVVLRVYDKVAEIEQQSGKVWLFDLWGRRDGVWRIEWQVRKEQLRRFGIRTLNDLQQGLRNVLGNLATTHDTLRVETSDGNRSRWPLHPLWVDLQSCIAQMDDLGIPVGIDPATSREYRFQVMATSAFGYLKAMSALRGIQRGRDAPLRFEEEALPMLARAMRRQYDALDWRTDVKKRMDQMRLGQG